MAKDNIIDAINILKELYEQESKLRKKANDILDQILSDLQDKDIQNFLLKTFMSSNNKILLGGSVNGYLRLKFADYDIKSPGFYFKSEKSDSDIKEVSTDVYWMCINQIVLWLKDVNDKLKSDLVYAQDLHKNLSRFVKYLRRINNKKRRIK